MKKRGLVSSDLNFGMTIAVVIVNQFNDIFYFNGTNYTLLGFGRLVLYASVRM